MQKVKIQTINWSAQHSPGRNLTRFLCTTNWTCTTAWPYQVTLNTHHILKVPNARNTELDECNFRISRCYATFPFFLTWQTGHESQLAQIRFHDKLTKHSKSLTLTLPKKTGVISASPGTVSRYFSPNMANWADGIAGAYKITLHTPTIRSTPATRS